MSKRLLCFLPVLVLALTACTKDERIPAGMVVVNARVIDGSGGPSQRVNVRIVNDRIAAIGEISPLPDDVIVDANGLALAPGFIDVHSHHDYGLLEDLDALAVVSQGVTTIVGGQDGGQQYPLTEYFAALEASPPAINVASFAGHGVLRGLVMGDDYKRPATADELSAMSELLQVEMTAGAIGLSTGLEYDPGSFSEPQEVVELAKVVASNGGMYLSHIRSEDQYFWEAVDEVINIGREAELPVQVTHIKLAMTRWWGRAEELIAKLDEARESGVNITADVYPYRAWTTSFSWLTTLFPDRDLDRRDGAEYVLNDMLSPEGILVASYVPEPAYSGMTVAEIAKILETDPETALMDLLKAEMAGGANGSGSQMLGFAMDEPDIEYIMAWPHTVIGSDGMLAGVHPRGYGAFTRYLGHYIRDREVLSIEEGVRRITSLAAEQIGIKNRGSIEVGQFADLVLFDPTIVADRSTPVSPHVPSAGIEKVWVNGEL
ncbi:MAG: N-acyl-D-amino-acid deacylase family protein, partial [Woeseiaceae bacterium]